MSHEIDVVAAVLQRPDGSFLLAQRPADKIYAGYWEFPGGKIESGESAPAALTRELHEELGIHVKLAYPWLTRRYTYPHATVKLNFFRVVSWEGELHGKENQQLAWQRPGEAEVAPLLPANGPILRALTLPGIYGITHAAETGVAAFLPHLHDALEQGLRLIQIREKNLPPGELADFAANAVRLAHAHGARVLINGDEALARAVGADGVHLSGAQLANLYTRPEADWVGASCHTPAELARAVELGVDFVLISPVLPTLTHPDAPALGWEAFARLKEDYPLPVYALGGMTPAKLETAWEHGAHGIAMMRDAWR